MGITGEPLRKASVSVQARDLNFSAVTDEAGAFAIQEVPPGTYSISVQRNGYVLADSSANARRAGTVTVAASTAVTGLEFKMAPHAVITGRVVDEDGEPMANIQIAVSRERWERGVRKSINSNGATTNDLGEFRVASLQPGNYFISATETTRMMPRTRSATEPVLRHPPTFYPGAPDLSQAVAIQARGGQETTGINFQLRKVATHRVRGKVLDAAGQPAPNAAVMLFSEDPSSPFNRNFSSANPDGSFTIAGVLPGRYQVTAQSRENRSPIVAVSDVQVGNSDIEGLTLQLAPPVAVSGQFVIDGDDKTTAAVDLSRARIDMSRTLPIPIPNPGQGARRAATADGKFVIESVYPGRYTIEFGSLPANAYPKAVRIGGVDVLARGLDVGTTPVMLEVVLGINAPSVSGTITDSEAKPLGDVLVALVPEGERRSQYHLYATATTGAAGSFNFSGLTPGDYKVIAVPKERTDLIYNPALLAQVEGRGTSVRLAEGKSETVTLKYTP